jgi:hypothetical protein
MDHAELIACPLTEAAHVVGASRTRSTKRIKCNPGGRPRQQNNDACS